MNGKQWVGEKALTFKSSDLSPAITQVILAADANNGPVYTAGSEGYSLSVVCPWASQQMANDLLSKAQGFQYQGFEASMAALPGSAERGDGVNIGGVYGMLADRTIHFNPGMNSDISAPWEEEVNHEYRYSSPIQQSINRQVGQVKAELTVDIDSITQQVTGINGELSQIKLDITGITQQVQDAEGNISTLQQTATSLQSQITSVSGEVSTVQQTVDGLTITTGSGSTMIKGSVIETGSLNLTGVISFSDLSSSVQSDINQIRSKADSAQSTATQAANTVGSWSYGGSTYIDGAKIMAGTVSASTLEGGSVNLLNYSGNTVGVMTMTGASTSSFAVDLTSYGALRLTAESGDVYAESGSGTYLQLSSIVVAGDGDFSSNQNGLYSCGRSGYRWSEVYAATSTITTSDRRLKDNITYDMSPYGALFDRLRPTPYRYNDGRSGRTHTGLIAQDVEQALADIGLTTQDFAGMVKGDDGADGEVYSLRYEEFIALCIDQIQQLKKRVATLEGST